MSTIQDLFLQSQLAEAAYADFSSPDITVQQALQNEGFSETQATEFLTHWRYVDQFTDSGLLFGDGSGFSATLFESLDHPGQYTFTIRGSQSWVDFTEADLSLGTGGIAFEQLIAMVNYVLRLDVGATGETAQMKATMVAGALPVVTWDSAMVQGEGPGISLDNLTATGHSLGGALAQMFQRIFGSAGVYTYNAVGVGDANSPVFDQVTALLGLAPGSFSSGTGDNLVVPGEPANYLGTVQGNPQQQIFTESADTNLISAHLMTYITDSLAVYNLFAKLDPALNTKPDGLQIITNILKAESNVAENTLESAITDLGKLFGVANSTYNANQFDGDGRNLLYTAIAGFDNIINAPFAVVPTIQSLVGMDASVLASNAQADIAYRYALQELNPFVATGMDYSGFNQNGELDLYNPATGDGTLSTEWLADRAAMLGVLIERNTQDIDDAPYPADTVYSDATSGIVLRPANASHVGEDALKQIRFGSNTGADPLDGGSQDDHLYGMGGNDTLYGWTAGWATTFSWMVALNSG